MLLRSTSNPTEVVRVADNDGKPAVARTLHGVRYAIAYVFYDLRGVLCDTRRWRLVAVADLGSAYEPAVPDEFHTTFRGRRRRKVS